MKISLEWLGEYLPGPLDPQSAAEALTTGGVHHAVRRDPLAAGQGRDRGPVGDRDVRDLLAEAEGDAEIAQLELERLDDLGIAEVEHLLALLDHGDS